ncbi:MAG: hypothetical protein ACREYF_23565 [Gammaproteobacteria bacterium]
MTKPIKLMFLVRSTRVRRVLAVLFLLNGLLPQLQTLFACALMDSQPRTVCCCADPLTDGCQMGGGCTVHDSVRGSEDCCQVLIGKLSDVAAAGAVAPCAQAGILDPLPLPTLPLPNVAVELAASTITRQHSIAPSYRSANNTYLITNRLRI